MNSNYVQAATLAIAVIGAVLGVLNTWRNWSADRVRLRVRRVHGFFGRGDCVGIEVVNLSAFAVTISEIGWTRPGTTRLVIAVPMIPSGEKFPVRLEPRTRFTGYAAPGAHEDASFASIDFAYATTACGVTRRHRRTRVVSMLDAATAAKR